MSDASYIAWSLLCAGILGGALGLLAFFGKRRDWARNSWTARGERLQRLLDQRLKRGTDKYFEELRSIHSQIEMHALDEPSSVARFRITSAILAILYMVSMGFIIVYFIGKPVLGFNPPPWSKDIVWSWMPISGAERLIESVDGPARLRVQNRIMGALMLALGLFMFATIFSHSTART